MRNVT